MKRFFYNVIFSVLMIFCGTLNSNAALNPIFSNPGKAIWYYIQFAKTGMVLTDGGQNEKVTIQKRNGSNTQLWKLVGDEHNFQLVSKDNGYAVIKGSYSTYDPLNSIRLYSGSQKDGSGFSLYKSSNTSYPSMMEIQHNKQYKNNKLSFNQWGVPSVGTEIGLYTPNDDNNQLEFVEYSSSDTGSSVDIPVTVHGSRDFVPADKYTLWYTEPATNWMEYSLPIGNGQFGASLFGGVGRDEIQFNEKTLWSGTSTSVGTTGWGGNDNNYGYYMNFGSMFITNRNPNLTVAENYHRELNLSNALGLVEYTNGDGSVSYRREYIASYPDKVVATHLTATQPGNISICVTLVPGVAQRPVSYNNGEAVFSGSLETVSYNARLKVVNKGGKISTSSRGIEVMGADEVLIILGGGTDFDANSPSYTSNTSNLNNLIDTRVDAAAQKGWDALYSAHIADYKPFFDRVRLDLTGSENTMTTKDLVDNYRGGMSANDLMLEELYFTYGRYLSIASSRGVALPSNLQGIWNNNNNAAWHSDIHANINVQMNYWPVEATNLSEMHEPFLQYIMNMSKSASWRRWAQESGQDRGWTCFTENNIFGGVGVWAHNYVIENAWYCTHLWQHYRYTLDEKFLAEAFPTMLTATQYWLDRLIEKNGQYLCPKEYSPEHGPEQEDGVAHAQQLVYDLFANTLEAINVLGENNCGFSTQDYNKLQDCFARLDKGLATEKYNGQWGNAVGSGEPLLREWKYSNFTAGQNGHRHLSHLMCLYPFSQVTSDSEYFTAAVNSLKLRGDQSTGWSMGWKINLWARALDGNHAHQILKLALRHSTTTGFDEHNGGIYYNLYDSHAPFQIDGNFGACAGITEMLFQSDSGILYLLPALPNTWNNGSVRGLKAVGNFTVDLAWNNQKATRVTITNNKGQQCKVKCLKADRTLDKCLIEVNGKPVSVVLESNNVYVIPSVEGDVITIDFTQDNSTDPVPPVEPEVVYSGSCGETLTWNLNPETGVLTIEGEGAMYDYTSENLPTWSPVAKEVKYIVLPETLTRIGDNALAECDNLSEITVVRNIEFGVNAVPQHVDKKLIITDTDYRNMDFPLNENTYSSVLYKRNLDSGKWGTIIFPFPLCFQSMTDYKFYQIGYTIDDTVYFTRVLFPEPNTPYIYKNASGRDADKLLSAGEVTISSTGNFSVEKSGWIMHGSYKQLYFDGPDLETLYFMSGGKVMHSSANLTILPFRVYFEGPAFNGKPVKMFVIDEDGGETDITNEIMEQLEEDGAIYDVLGRKVEETIPGNIYIRNHKKFLAQ